MKEKKWIDCPVCGAQGTMKFKTLAKESITPLGYKSIKIGPLSGQFCSKCGDGFYDKASLRLRESQIAEGKALQDAERVKASDLVSIEYIAEKAFITKQRVSKMMDEGKLPYVIICDKIRMPIRQKDSFYRNLVSRSDAKVRAHNHK